MTRVAIITASGYNTKLELRLKFETNTSGCKTYTANETERDFNDRFDEVVKTIQRFYSFTQIKLEVAGAVECPPGKNT